MRRRPFLAALSRAALSAIAGCSAFDGEPPPVVTPASVPAEPFYDSIRAAVRHTRCPTSRSPVRAASSSTPSDSARHCSRRDPERSTACSSPGSSRMRAQRTRPAVRFANTTTETRRYVHDRPRLLGRARLSSPDGELAIVPTGTHPDADPSPRWNAVPTVAGDSPLHSNRTETPTSSRFRQAPASG